VDLQFAGTLDVHLFHFESPSDSLSTGFRNQQRRLTRPGRSLAAFSNTFFRVCPRLVLGFSTTTITTDSIAIRLRFSLFFQDQILHQQRSPLPQAQKVLRHRDLKMGSGGSSIKYDDNILLARRHVEVIVTFKRAEFRRGELLQSVKYPKRCSARTHAAL
jgi:hypothetical protein